MVNIAERLFFLAYLTAAAVSWVVPTTSPSVEGRAKFYDDGVMEEVAVNRGYISNPYEYETWLKQEEIDGGAALMKAGDLGRAFTILWPDGTATRHISIDCADPKHFPKRRAIGDIVEVDWQTAQLKGMRGPVRVRIIFDSPTRKKHVQS